MNAEEMVRIPAGRFRMGQTGFYPEEEPVRQVEVEGFLIDRGPVTVAQFARFVDQTGYVTLAERAPDPGDYRRPILLSWFRAPPSFIRRPAPCR